jgi:hypothetical protein
MLPPEPLASSIPESEQYQERMYYEYIAKQVEREDGLINSRLTWMLTTQGFLFAALALIAKQEEAIIDVYNVLIIVLPAAGFILSITGISGNRAAGMALDDLIDAWESRVRDKPSLNKLFPRPFGDVRASFFGAIQSTALPVVLCIVWVVVFFSTHRISGEQQNQPRKKGSVTLSAAQVRPTIEPDTSKSAVFKTEKPNEH